ncbi:restriction endonuclease subunit S [Escherichia marmotae]|nr:restriction endonuclease subunit S [Escherichia marmotae]
MSAGKLPEGWVETQLGKIIELKYGKSLAAPSRDGKYFPVYGSNGIVGMHSAPLINGAGLIVGRKGSYGVVQKSTGPFFPIDTTYYIDDFYNQPIDYWYYYLTFLPLTKLNRSTAIPGLNREDAYNLNIVIPSLAEQKIIAEKLDTLLAQVDSTKARLEQIPQILKRFRQAVLAAAVSGKLTNRPDQNRHWKELLLSDIASHIVDCPHSTPKWSSEGKYCVRTTAFTPFNLDLSKQGFVDEKTYQDRIQRLKPETDDILYSREGTIGIACQIPKGVELCLGQRMVLIRASDKISSKYLTIVLNSNKILKIVKSKTMGSTAPRINMADIKSYPIPLPPLPEQAEIVRRVEQLFAYADTIEKQVNNALARVNNLTQSILAKAFRGELTAQWRAENPELISGENSAAALLEKIKAERAASGGKKASRKKS